mgnify:CR=1 FL=1
MIKVIHIEGGLGNQMACYAVFVAAQESNPQDDFYIDTYVYDVKESHSTISMWNGYELEKIFGLKLRDIRSLFTPEQVNEQLEYLKKSQFWKHDWNYAEVFIQMMKNYDISLRNAYGRVIEMEKNLKTGLKYAVKKLMAESAKNKVVYQIKKIAYSLNNHVGADKGKYLYMVREGDYYYDITLDFMKSAYLCNKLGERMRKDLAFDEPRDAYNKAMLEKVDSVNSISIHVRRTDYLQFNEDCYKFGYFKKSVKYIKKHVEEPEFFVFSDDLDWCRSNIEVIGLTEMDDVTFVGINSEANSYRDMQIMSRCKHNISTKSSFGWWASFLNANASKITCCQVGPYVCTKQF